MANCGLPVAVTPTTANSTIASGYTGTVSLSTLFTNTNCMAVHKCTLKTNTTTDSMNKFIELK